MLKKLGLLCASVAVAFAMNGAEININDKDLEVGGYVDMGQIVTSIEPDTVLLGVKYLKGDESHSDFNVNDNAYYEANFLMQKHDVYTTGLTVGMGLKVNYTRATDASLGGTRYFASIPVGVVADYQLPADAAMPIYLGGSIYYAPEVLCLNDAKNFFEYRINLDFEIIENGRITLGYRSLNTTYDVNTRSVDKNYNHSGYIGVKFQF
ncbi:YfaZ family protein [bacterium]|nr:YfaZ family protein [bacterium]MBU1882822.1 YfaZ family protein [bacterium]